MPAYNDTGIYAFTYVRAGFPFGLDVAAYDDLILPYFTIFRP